jgi:hypothetical protein
MTTHGELTPDQRERLWEQFVEEHAKAQEQFDSSVRTLAAAGLAVTVSLATALKTLSGTGLAAVGLFLVSLGLNILSYVFAQLDMGARLTALGTTHGYKGAERSRWTTVTWLVNVGAATALVGGGVLLVVFIASAT